MVAWFDSEPNIIGFRKGNRELPTPGPRCTSREQKLPRLVPQWYMDNRAIFPWLLMASSSAFSVFNVSAKSCRALSMLLPAGGHWTTTRIKA